MNLSIPPQRAVIQIAARQSSLHQVACPALLLSRAALLIGGLIFTASAAIAAPFDAGAAPKEFVAVDTSRLMGSPESPASLGVEHAFPALKFERPLELVHAGDGSGRLFVVEQGGRIRVFANDRDVKESNVFLDLSEVVRRGHNEEGLLGLAFHPKFKTNGEFFVFYSVTPMGSVISRFRVSKDDAGVADRASEEKLLSYAKPHGNHNGGSLKFGPDGFLYISVGDGGAGHDPHGNAQDLTDLFGSILRIDVGQRDAGRTYAVPKDNPFVERGAAARGEVWAYGLRNPWRMAFDREGGALWVADVGQDEAEEVNVITRGGNYGWNLREGAKPLESQAGRPAGDFIAPVFEYPRIEGKSVTGGLVYRGSRLPQLVGAYLYADYMSGNIWALRLKPQTQNTKIARTSLLISAFGEDEKGEVYFPSFDGAIYQFKQPENQQSAEAFPTTLTETGLFASVKDHTPAAGLIPYTVNVPLWSDGAEKSRFLVLPKQASVVFHEKEKWEFPIGTVFVKTFLLPTDTEKPAKLRRLETRLWLHAPRGWEGYTYLWNNEQTEAHLLADWPLEQEFKVMTPKGPETRKWYFPSRSDCIACHTHSVGFALGWNTRQLNRPYPHGENQLTAFERLGLFKDALPAKPTALEQYPDWEKKAGPVATLARAYLDANCAMCHSPGGPGNAQGSRADLDFHRTLAEAVGGEKTIPPWVTAGQPAHSRALQRMSSREPKEQMPPLATSRVDEAAVALLKRWIEELPAGKAVNK